MTQEDWTKMNKESHYNSLIKQDSENRKLIKKLQLERDELKEKLRTDDVSQQREMLKSFADWLQGEVWDDKHDDFSDYVEDYVKTL